MLISVQIVIDLQVYFYKYSKFKNVSSGLQYVFWK